jgi:hypothetical protein
MIFSVKDIEMIKSNIDEWLLPKKLCKTKGSLPVEQLFYLPIQVLLLMRGTNLIKLFMIMWDKVQETVQFIKTKNDFNLNMVLYWDLD